MDAHLYQQVKEIVAQIWQRPKNEWPMLIDKLCVDDLTLRQEVEAFLVEDVGDDFLTQSPLEIAQEDEEGTILRGRIGRIKIEHLIATGGMGEVYAGFDEVLKRKVAIKIMSADMRLSSERRQAFLNEAQVLSSLQHSNICQIYDFFEDQDRDVLVLELIKGKTLRFIMDEDTVKNPINIAIQIADALTIAHERGIIHRDLKPDNIMITDQGVIKILDFGLARISENAPASTQDNVNPKMTQISGTPGYMSPEQARGEQSNSATDLWSFGLVLSELLTNKRPFSEQSSSTQLLERAKRAQVEVPNNLPKAETFLLKQLLSPKTQDRPSARATLDTLKNIQNRTAKRLRTIAIIGVLALVILAGWKYTSDLKIEQNIAIKAQILAEQKQQAALQARIDAEDLIAFMLDDLHTGLRDLGKLELLESVANQAKDYYEKLSDEQIQASDGKVAIALVRLSEVLTDSGRNNEAINLLQQAKEILTKFQQNKPNNDLLSYRLGFVLYNLGDLFKIAGLYQNARDDLNQAIILGNELTQGFIPGDGPQQQPSATQRWRLLLRSQYLLADSYTRFGGAKEAARILEKAVRLAIPAAQFNPELIINLSDIQFKRCDTYSELGQADLQLEACLATLDLDKQLYEKNPDNYEYHKNMMGDYAVVSKAYLNLKQYKEALAATNEGIRIGKLLINWDTANANTQNEFVSILLAKARVLHTMGNIKQSQIIFKEAYDIVMPLAQDHEEITYLHHAFIALVHLGYRDEARKIATTLDLRGFKRREFKDLCVKYTIQECMEEN
jgi:tRNA A-37 threonylcarbamoyl transferase component Bud32/tetratricopeptide (TPR) repeat protein